MFFRLMICGYPQRNSGNGRRKTVSHLTTCQSPNLSSDCHTGDEEKEGLDLVDFMSLTPSPSSTPIPLLILSLIRLSVSSSLSPHSPPSLLSVSLWTSRWEQDPKSFKRRKQKRTLGSFSGPAACVCWRSRYAVVGPSAADGRGSWWTSHSHKGEPGPCRARCLRKAEKKTRLPLLRLKFSVRKPVSFKVQSYLDISFRFLLS